MTLVVGAFDDDQFTIVSDTKVTWEGTDGHTDEARTRNTYFEALPKIVRLRGDLVVGVAGADPLRVIERLVAVRTASVADVLAHLETEANNEFVLAALHPRQLWEVRYGSRDDRTETPRRASAGDPDAWDRFRESFDGRGMETMDLDFRMMAGMQFLTSFDPVRSTGGLTLKVTAVHDEFRFEPMHSWIMPPLWPGADTTSHRILVVPGDEPMRGALGLLIPETGKGRVFPEDRPWEGFTVRATCISELVTAAQDNGVVLTSPATPSGFA